MEHPEIISKDPKSFRIKPNLASYDEAAASPQWDSVKSELKWFDGGGINYAYNAIDRHLGTPVESKTALLWEGDRGDTASFTFGDLARLSNQYANFLTGLGVKKGDRVFLFLPRIPVLYCAFLGTLKTGAVAGLLFSAFQETALFDRLENSGASVLFTTTELSSRISKVRDKLPNLKHIVTVNSPDFVSAISRQPDSYACVRTVPDDYAFMLYTSGTTGKPKGVVHAHRGAVQAYLTARWVLDLHPDDIYWCTADPGWVTGIVYGILAPWMLGITMVVHAGRFDPDTWYGLLEKYHVTVWYTAPTAIRMLMAKGTEPLKTRNLSSLRYLASVGEPLNPEAIRWGVKAFGMPFHDTWWQTETGSIMMANYPTLPIKIGSMGKPFPGITAGIIEDDGSAVADGKEGNLAFKPGWPSMMATVWQNQKKYDSYFTAGWYVSGDRAWRDSDGYYWFVGRSDDVIKTSGERVGPFEVESALVEHPEVAEAGVIGKPDQVRGEIIKAFVVLKNPMKFQKPEDSAKLTEELQVFVKKNLAGHAYPREIEFIDRLPKTRSGKIMRRILKAKEMGQPIGDTSTLEEY
ncbi:acetate--CoA ligase [Candidatus Gottesmanbacteria bacterium RBG_16_52_11]|uniref:acetate--CoA ligase n=1 Tax=Candidatus Gottesmanbacteria bacterium RBG_16_52_11 TaxID=1798374 RepID=A0A1F5YQT2_9BACT|nr:MAG: acetate--CoA ligase [Candidatus Gottesmanbacteria bacterium RBG_16_52_11]